MAEVSLTSLTAGQARLRLMLARLRGCATSWRLRSHSLSPALTREATLHFKTIWAAPKSSRHLGIQSCSHSLLSQRFQRCGFTAMQKVLATWQFVSVSFLRKKESPKRVHHSSVTPAHAGVHRALERWSFTEMRTKRYSSLTAMQKVYAAPKQKLSDLNDLIIQQFPEGFFVFNGFSPCRKVITHLLVLVLCFVPIWLVMATEPVFDFDAIYHQVTAYIIVSGFFFSQKSLKEPSENWLFTAVIAVLTLGYIGLIVLSPQWTIPYHEPILWAVGVTMIFVASLLSVIPFGKLTVDLLLALFIHPTAVQIVRAREAKEPSKLGGFYCFLAAIFLFAVLMSNYQFFSYLQRGFQ